jgi:hypothetical protein
MLNLLSFYLFKKKTNGSFGWKYFKEKKNGFQFNFGLNSLNKILKKERKKIPIN